MRSALCIFLFILTAAAASANFAFYAADGQPASLGAGIFCTLSALLQGGMLLAWDVGR